MAKRMLRMEAVIYMPMEENETQDEAEDRMLEKIEDSGMEVYSWTGVHVAKQIDIERADT